MILTHKEISNPTTVLRFSDLFLWNLRFLWQIVFAEEETQTQGS